MTDTAVQREPTPEVDWRAIEDSPEFQQLVRKRRSFVLPATIFFLAWYMGFIVLTAYAEGFMSERVYEGLTVGYCLALTQFVMVVALGVMYLRRSAKVYDPLAEKAIERQLGRTGRFVPTERKSEEEAVGSRSATPTTGGER